MFCIGVYIRCVFCMCWLCVYGIFVCVLCVGHIGFECLAYISWGLCGGYMCFVLVCILGVCVMCVRYVCMVSVCVLCVGHIGFEWHMFLGGYVMDICVLCWCIY